MDRSGLAARRWLSFATRRSPREVSHRKRRARSIKVEPLEDRNLLVADLAPAFFPGWDDSLVISTTPATTTSDATILESDSVFVDVGWANFGTTSVPASSFLTRLSLDGVPLVDLPTPVPLDPFFGWGEFDLDLGQLPVGSHTLSLTVDVNDDVAEASEVNNLRERTFTVHPTPTMDFGDAPAAGQTGFASTYPTLLADDGARHTRVAGFSLGAEIDVDVDGQPTLSARGDDTSEFQDDEDGVRVDRALAIGAAAAIVVDVTNTAGVGNPYLDVWIDFNRDGDWEEFTEHVFTGPVVAGSNTLNFTVPTSASAGPAYARFRLHDGAAGLAVRGPADSGEVEDHLVTLAEPDVWMEQGAASTQNGQVQNVIPDNRVAGAIHTVLAHPTDPDTLYIGAVNGGIWKTTNATALFPDWSPQTDFLDSLSIGAMSFDPTDATHQTLVAGTANYSSFGLLGGDRGLILRTTDGGRNWTQLPSGGLTVAGENISGIAARGRTIVVTSSGNRGGVFRSVDGGASFVPIDAADFDSPADNFTDLVEDPSDPSGQRLYAAAIGVGGPGGIYRSDDFGVTWTKISDPGLSPDLDELLRLSNNVEMAVHPDTGRLFAAVLVSGQPRGIFYTGSGPVQHWTRMDIPVLPLTGGAAISVASNTAPIEITSADHRLVSGDFVVIDGVTGNTAANGFHQVAVTGSDTFVLLASTGNGTYTGGGTWTRVTGANPRAKDIDETGAQGRIHFSIRVDPTDENIVYLGGDRQDRPNAIGDFTFGGAIFRGDTRITRNPNVVPSPQWDHLTHNIVPLDFNGGTASGSAPHADSREMVFDAAGNLIEVDDGGIFKRTSPRDNTGDWFSLAGNLGVVEFHDVAYDSNSDVLIGGAQDNGTQFQMFPGGQVWDFLSGGDGGDVLVDAETFSAANRTIRYSSFQNLAGFRRTIWDENNRLLATEFPTLAVTSGAPLLPQFKTPVELNAVDPQRLLFVGRNAIYESQDQGDTLAQLGGPHPVPVGFVQDAADYGGFRNGVPNPDVFYVGVGDRISSRTAAGGPIITVDANGSGTDAIRDVVMHADNWAQAFAVDSDQVFWSADAGVTWADVTGNLAAFAGAALRTIEFIPGPLGAVVVGGNLGVFAASVNALGAWREIGTSLPHAPVWDLKYDAVDDVLVAGTLGRGAWTLFNTRNTINRAPQVNSLVGGTGLSTSEITPAGKVVGQVLAADPDGDPLAFALDPLDSNFNGINAFAIDSTTGEIRVLDKTELDFERQRRFRLTVRATDLPGAGSPKTGLGTIEINLTDSEPRILDQRLRNVNENSPPGLFVGTVLLDQRADQNSVSFSIVGGNPGGAFAIDPATGAVTVGNSAPLDFETTPQFELVVQVSDDGGATVDAAKVIIKLNDLPDGNQDPVLAAIGNQLAAPGELTHHVKLSATDADNDSLTFSATVSTLEFFLDQQLDLSVHPDGLFPNLYGGNERWLFSFSSHKWYYILPANSPAQLYEWDETPFTLSGTLIADLNPGTHANPSLLAEAAADPVPATAEVVGSTLAITKVPATFEGTVVVTANVSDGRGGTDSESFTTTFPSGAPPVLAAIGDRTSATGTSDIVINLSASDPDGDPLTFHVSLITLEQSLDEQHDLSLHPLGLLHDLYGGGEKWLYSFSNNKWYFILPNEELYEWDNTPFVLNGTLIAMLNAGTFANPARLYEAAANPPPVPGTATLVGNVLTITKQAGFFGTMVVTVRVDDGTGGSDSETFRATFVPAARSARAAGRDAEHYLAALDIVLTNDLLDQQLLSEVGRALFAGVGVRRGD